MQAKQEMQKAQHLMAVAKEMHDVAEIPVSNVIECQVSCHFSANPVLDCNFNGGPVGCFRSCHAFAKESHGCSQSPAVRVKLRAK